MYLTTSMDPAPDLKKSVVSSTSTFKMPPHTIYTINKMTMRMNGIVSFYIYYYCNRLVFLMKIYKFEIKCAFWAREIKNLHWATLVDLANFQPNIILYLYTT